MLPKQPMRDFVLGHHDKIMTMGLWILHMKKYSLQVLALGFWASKYSKTSSVLDPCH